MDSVIREVAFRWMLTFAVCGLIVALAPGQAPSDGARPAAKRPDKKKKDSDPPAKPASIEGIVLGEDTGRPLRRAEVALKPADSRSRSYSEATGDDGQFSFPEVAPGIYSIAVERAGYLPAYFAHQGGTRLAPIFTVRDGAHMGDVSVRMQPWGVIAGKVKFNDGEPAIHVLVQLYREYFYRGMHGFTVAASSRTNDRGEYRTAGLAAGAYYAAAVYQRPVILPGAEEPRRKSVAGQPLPDLRYAITFYPSATKLTEAVPVTLRRGQEVNVIDIFLAPVNTVRVHGKVISGLTGRTVPTPAMVLRRADANDTASIGAPVELSYDRDESFSLKGVVPGAYYFILNGSEDNKSLTARPLITVGEAGIDEMSIMLKPPAVWKGLVQVEGDDSIDLASLSITLEPRRDTAGRVSTAVKKDGAFSLTFTPGETYDLVVEGGGPDAYLKAVRVANSDMLVDGLKSESGDEPAPLQVVLAANGGKIGGRVLTPENQVASGATVMLVPDPPRGRLQYFKTAYADENGIFYIQGVAPGRYILLPWLDEQPCEVYDASALDLCRAKGTVVDVTTEGQTIVEIRIAPSF